MIERVKTREVRVGSKIIGGNNPITIQSMTNTQTADVTGTLAQIKALETAGCDIVRVSVYDPEAAEGFKKIRQGTTIPLVADIHFDYRMALAAIDAGADKIRINPGNIGGRERVEQIVAAAKANDTAIRVGVNSGSLQKDLLKKYGHPTPQALAESALRYVELMDELNFDQLVISLKASNVITTLEACEEFSKLSNFPQHIGITEAGTPRSGAIKSAAGLGAILSRGIGDTMRVSLAGDPVEEIAVASNILKAYGLRKGPTLIACPTCGRTRLDLAGLANQVEDLVGALDYDITIAVMGCIVNGPGEAREADVGVAGGKGEGLLFVDGEIVKKLPESELLPELMALVHKIGKERQTD